MGWTDFLLRLRAMRSRTRAEGDLDEELQFHMAMEARKRRLEGVSDTEARRRAHVEFGGVEQVREECRDIRGLTMLENLVRDVRYGFRVLRKTPVFTAVAVLSLAIGIGANTAIFSLVDTVLLRMLPVRNPEQLVVLKWGARRAPRGVNSAYSYGDGEGRFRTNVFSWRIFTTMRATQTTLADVFAFSPMPRLSVVVNGEARITGGMVVSGNYFSSLGVGTVLGRPILDDDDTVDGTPAAVISYRLWEQRFSSAANVVGKTIYINRVPFTVVGVTPRAYYGVSAGGFLLTPEIDISLPFRSRERLVQNNPHGVTDWFAGNLFWVQAMGRLTPGADPRPAEAELTTILNGGLPETALRDEKAGPSRVELIPGAQGLDFLRRDFKKPLLILMAVVGMVLLMSCANLAGMLLARAASRRKEIAVRLSLGASRLRLIRQLLIEGALLSTGGAVAGLALAFWGVRALLAMLVTSTTGFAFEVRPDARLLAFTFAVSLLTTLLFGLAPALRATRQNLASEVKADTPLSGGGGFRSVGALLAVQIAVALILLAGATLFSRSLANLRAIPLGMNPQKLVMFGITPGANGYDEARGNRLYSNLLDRLKRIPGVTGATLSVQTPLSGLSWSDRIRIPGEDSSSARTLNLNFVGPEFFETMQIPIVLGRGIDQRDSATSLKVAVISESTAREFFGGGSPVGRKFQWAEQPGQDIEVVGVVKDAKYDHLQKKFGAVAYLPYQQNRNGFSAQAEYELRTAVDPAPVIAAARAAVAEFDRMLPLLDIKTMEGQIDEALAQQRLFASLVSLFGSMTLVLACVGLYGLVSYSVASRTREIGVRMALGAGRLAVLRMLLGQVAVTTSVGLAVGLPAARALTRLIESQLYGIHANDALSLAIAGAAVVLVAMLAAAIPARRAMRIDPVRALRYE